MAKYVLKRLSLMLITLFSIATLTFFMMHAIPGGPFNTTKNVPPAVIAALEAKFHINEPVHQQYLRYMGDLLKGDLGPSIKYQGETVVGLIKSGLPSTAEIGLISIVVVVLVSFPLGIIAALKNGKWQDGLLMAFATIGVTIPSYIIASILLYVFGVKLRWVPTFGLETANSLILPVIALSAYSIAFIARLMRSSLLDVMNQDYIRTARAKGIPEVKVVYRHALRNAMLPVVTVLGPLLAGLLTGSFAIERIFAIPGNGKHFVDSISNRDYPTIMGITLFYAVLLVVMIFVVDIFYVIIDPRIKME